MPGLTVLLLALVHPAAASPASQPAPASASPGRIATLLQGHMGPAEIALCGAALAGPRADSRAAAARVARVNGLGQLVPALAQSLASEADLGAAREEAVALGWLVGSRAHDALFAAAARFGGELNSALVLGITGPGNSALELVPRLNALSLNAHEWRLFFTWATQDGRVDLEAAVAAAGDTGSSEAWGGVLFATSRGGRTLPDADTARAMGGGSPRVRDQTCRFLLSLPEPEKVVGPETRAALAGALAAAPTREDDASVVLMLEVLNRALGRAATDRTALVRGLTREVASRLPADRAFLAGLRGPERKALGEARLGDADWANDILKRTPKSPVSALLRDLRIRTPHDFPAGVVSDVFAVTGCTPPGEPAWALMEARSNPDRSLGRIGFHFPEVSEACTQAARTLLLMSVLPTDRPPRASETDLVLLPLSREFAECADPIEPLPREGSAELAADGLIPPSKTHVIEKPRKTRSVPPRYPPAAKNEGREGLIILETTIGTRGCIRSAEVLWGEHRDLAGEALRSVVQWRYTPTLLKGRPVPVIMTVTVNFDLR